MKPQAAILVVVVSMCTAAFAQNSSVVNSRHNLSVSGPGVVRAAGEEQICIFCHTPHNAAPIQPLWNRYSPVSAYTVYRSSSLDAVPGQPTGSSKLCLSCHDGTIAVGSVLSRGQPIQMAGGITTLPPGQGNLGTDLSDDHPISFRYDAALSAKDPKILQPTGLPAQIRLDSNSELQCTTCHNAHNDQFGKFLVMNNGNSQLCKSCHDAGSTTVTEHQQCASCHQPHSAPSGPFLLRGATVSDACTTCHNGAAGKGANILADLSKVQRHDTRPPVDNPQKPVTEVSCNDCHGSHTIKAQSASVPLISPKLGDIGGVSASGAKLAVARYEYEVCFKCHGDTPATTSRISRQIAQSNTRLEFDPGSPSFHPVEAAGKNNDVPSLMAGWTTASQVYCSDCHGSDTSKKAGGTGPNGTHGSNQRPLLIAGYNTTDGLAESTAAYALCYKCHDRTRIISETGPFPLHKKHIVDSRTPCSVCHDAHGISSAQGTTANNSRLINFDITVVQPSANGKREFRSMGSRAGMCSLTCHGNDHNAKSYPN